MNECERDHDAAPTLESNDNVDHVIDRKNVCRLCERVTAYPRQRRFTIVVAKAPSHDRSLPSRGPDVGSFKCFVALAGGSHASHSSSWCWSLPRRWWLSAVFEARFNNFRQQGVLGDGTQLGICLGQ
jgi:hypothetical protein